jgi:ABC-type iron transport system FetAB ATPase subunit
VGKSSLLRCLVRLDEPAGGQVLVDGEDARDLDACALRRRVGLVAQQPVMLPGSVADNVGYGLTAASREALGAALVAAGLGADLLDRRARELSGGEAARVAIARALARGPSALLLDEPTAALDAATARGIGALVRALAGQGLGVLVVTHDEAWAAGVATSMARLRDGALA